MNRIRKRLLGACLLLAFIFSGDHSAFGQEAVSLTQTVRGTVTDADSKAPLPGATRRNEIIIRGNSPKYMQWRLEGIPPGSVYCQT